MALNHAAGAAEISAALEAYALTAGEQLDLSKALERAGKLQALGAQLNKLADRKDWQDGEAKKFNQAMLAIAHELIPLSYVSGDLFEQDLAVNLPAVPLLKDIWRLSETKPGSPEAFEWQTLLKRRLNKVEFALLKAIRIAESLIE